jgi:hypothetical protein
MFIISMTEEGQVIWIFRTIILYKIKNMKKLLLPIEGDRYPQELLDFVGTLQPLAPVLLTAAFVPESDYISMAVLRERPASKLRSVYEDEDRMVQQNRGRMEQFCQLHDIRLTVHEDREDFALPCLHKESRYADLMLLEIAHFFEEMDSKQPNEWMKEMLRQSECPVLLLPDNPVLPGELILAYDGSAASVFAIRQFAYLFPEFCRVQATLVYVSDSWDAIIPEEEAIHELCSLHFKKLRILKLQMKSADFYDTWIGMMTNPWLVTGSFGRRALSEAFSKSFSTELIRQHRVPVFITHR